MQTALRVIVAALSSAALALVLVEFVRRIFRRLGRRSVLLAELARQSHRPFQGTCALIAVRLAVMTATADFTGRSGLLHALLIAEILAIAWLIASLLLVLEDVALARFRTDVPDNRQARRIHTQVLMLRRVTVAVIVLLAVGVLMMTFPQVRTIGASLLASAGVIGVVAALAAQSVLGNVLAGLQLAFSDAVRLDDVVVVEGEWGKIEEMTLSHVVVQIWDDRRLILPTSYFTTKPFQNWTRTEAAVLGTVDLEVDWSADVTGMREELRRLVEGTQLWDKRVCVLQVTDAVGGSIRLRALVSAADAPALWDLRCLVREHLVAWVRDHSPTALPRMRAEVAGSNGPQPPAAPWAAQPSTAAQSTAAQSTAAQNTAAQNTAARPGLVTQRGQVAQPGPVTQVSTTVDGEPADDARVFGGSDDGEARNSAFIGPDHVGPDHIGESVSPDEPEDHVAPAQREGPRL